jgi:hypothetical protein
MLLKRPMLEMQIQISACEYFRRQSQSWNLFANVQLDRFCGEDEEHDPGEEYEEYLACAVCGDNGKLPFSFDCSAQQ